MNHQERFDRLLLTLATRCGTTLDAMEVEIYDKHVGQAMGYQAAADALERILVERQPGDRLPSVSAIRSHGDPEDKALASSCAAKIIGSIATQGYNWAQKLLPHETFDEVLTKEFGQAGADAVKQLGGWSNICQRANQGNLSSLQAQIREIVATNQKLLDRGKSPQLPYKEARYEKIGDIEYGKLMNTLDEKK